MSNQWVPFDESLGYSQQLPKEGKSVLVLLEMIRDDGSKDLQWPATACVVGYLKRSGGEGGPPYFVCHSIRPPWVAKAWMDCLPESIDRWGLPLPGYGLTAACEKPSPVPEWMLTSSPAEKAFIGDENFESVLDKCLANDILAQIVAAHSGDHVPIGAELKTSQTVMPWSGMRTACVTMADVFLNLTYISYALGFPSSANARPSTNIWVDHLVESLKPTLKPINEAAMRSAIRKMIQPSTDSEIGRLIEESNGASVVMVDHPPSLEIQGNSPVVEARQVGPREWEVQHIEAHGIWPSWAKPKQWVSTFKLVQPHDVWDTI